MACGFSNFKQHYATGVAFAYSLETIGAFYADYLRMMDHFDRVQPGAVHHLLNEKLIDDPEGEVRRLLDEAGIADWAVCSNGSLVVHLVTGERLLDERLRERRRRVRIATDGGVATRADRAEPEAVERLPERGHVRRASSEMLVTPYLRTALSARSDTKRYSGLSRQASISKPAASIASR